MYVVRIDMRTGTLVSASIIFLVTVDKCFFEIPVFFFFLLRLILHRGSDSQQIIIKFKMLY